MVDPTAYLWLWQQHNKIGKLWTVGNLMHFQGVQLMVLYQLFFFKSKVFSMIETIITFYKHTEASVFACRRFCRSLQTLEISKIVLICG